MPGVGAWFFCFSPTLRRNLEQKDFQCQANRSIPEPKFWQRFQFLTVQAPMQNSRPLKSIGCWPIDHVKFEDSPGAVWLKLLFRHIETAAGNAYDAEAGWEVRGGKNSNWELSYFQIKSFLRWKAFQRIRKCPKRSLKYPHIERRHDLWNEDFPSFEFSPPRFASRLAAFPSAGRQAALRALTKPVQLAAAPTIASQVRGHAGQTMQEWSMKIWGQFLFDEMLLLLGELLCMLMDVDCDKGCFLPAAMSRWTISCLFRHWIKFYSSSHLLRHRLVRQNCCHRMSSDAQCCRGCLISTSSSNCWGKLFSFRARFVQEMLVANMDLPMGAWKWGCWVRKKRLRIQG